MSDPAFHASRIVYFVDRTRAGAPVIPLGILAEVSTDHVYGLGLKARTKLTTAELEQISPLLREQIVNPFAFLRREFEDAWEKAPGDALALLTRRHNSSLSILAPVDCVDERSWLAERLLPARNDAIEAKLGAAVHKAFEELEEAYGAKDIAQKAIVETERKAA